MSTAHRLKMHKFEFYLPADGATTKADDAGAKVKIHKPLPKAQLNPKLPSSNLNYSKPLLLIS